MENRKDIYVPVYARKNSNVDFVIPANSPPFLQSSEYKFDRQRNNFGFRDKDFERKKDSSILLIQTYGDSFTEGDGAPEDSSYPSTLRTILNSHITSKKTIIQNFGISGSDPGFYCRQMEDIGVKLKPDLAIITYSSFDFTADFLTRGGLERFKEGYWQALQGPSWEWIYASSYFFRLICNSVFGITHANFFLSEEGKAERLILLKVKWNETFQRIALLASQHHFQVILVKKPERSEVITKKYMYDFSFFETMADTIPIFKRFDLLPFYIDSVNIGNENSALYYWPLDSHHKPKGYAVMARGVYTGLVKFYPDLFVAQYSVRVSHN